MWRWLGRRASNCQSRVLQLALVVIVASASCSKSSDPMGPTSNTLIGDWEGTIASDAIGAGTLRLSVTSEIGTPPSRLISGTFSTAFATPGFDVRGDFSGGPGTEPQQLGLFFDRVHAPCPGQPGGSAERALLAVMTLSGSRMAGRYVVADCPGGSIDITRR